MEPTAPTTPNNETAGFLTNLYAGCDEGWVTLFAAHPDGRRITRWAPAAQAAQLANDAVELDGWNVWFGCATRKQRLDAGRRGGKEDCAAIPALWVDIDIAGAGHATTNTLPDENQAWKLITDFALQPTVIIASGHGLQAWWQLQEPHPLENSDLLARWGTTWARHAGQAGFHLDNVFDAPRIMRLPGTTNTKTGCPPAPVTIEHDDWRKRYGVDDLEQHLDPAAAQPVNHAGVPYIGPDRPGDAYNAKHSTGDLLTQLGFIATRRERDGNQHWKWPAAAGDQSATTWVDGHATIWSETAAQQLGLKTQRPYDPYGIYTDTHHHGDYTAAARELAANGYGAPTATLDQLIATPQQNQDDANPEQPDPELADYITPINWPEFWSTDSPIEEWIVAPIVPKGRQVALFAAAKAGKSLLSLEIAAAVATGRAVLGQETTDPINVIYIDQEMTDADLRERLGDLGYGHEDDLTRLHYYQLTSLPPLDGPIGGAILEAIVIKHDARLVVLDTMARVVEGDENDSDTYRDFYRHTGGKLKALGASLLRLDHSGKHLEKGQRGSSAKADDVDVVFQFSIDGTDIKLKRTHSRVPWVPAEIELKRIIEPELRHVLINGATNNYPAGTFETARALDEINVPLDSTVTAAKTALKKHGQGKRTAIVAAALKYRRTALERVSQNTGNATYPQAGNERETDNF